MESIKRLGAEANLNDVKDVVSKSIELVMTAMSLVQTREPNIKSEAQSTADKSCASPRSTRHRGSSQSSVSRYLPFDPPSPTQPHTIPGMPFVNEQINTCVASSLSTHQFIDFEKILESFALPTATLGPGATTHKAVRAPAP